MKIGKNRKTGTRYNARRRVWEFFQASVNTNRVLRVIFQEPDHAAFVLMVRGAERYYEEEYASGRSL